MLRYIEKGMSIVQALIAVLYERTELLLRFIWCLACLTREEYDSREGKKSVDEKGLLLMSLRDWMICEEMKVACAKWGDAL